jgi:flagellar biosynthesis protein FlhB
MSFDELKRDHKQSEGDPLLRGKRRQRHRSLVRGPAAKLARAAFVVANPTHVAIALEYRPPVVAVPRVLVRAIDEGAREIKRRARELRIPIIENVTLARSLLASADVGEYIPPAAYVAVAAIVASLVREGAIR